jgi:two-component system, LytTR family, response regulator
MTDRLSALIIEDEPLARDLLQSMLQASDRVDVIGTAGTVAEAISAIAEQQPDVLFLDIEMPDGTGFDVVESLGPDAMPGVVFVTAYDRHAVRAFEIMALDYLLKPFDEERLHRCIEGVHARLREGQAALGSQLRSMVEELRAHRGARYAERLPVDAETHMKLIPAEEIEWLEAKGKHVLVHTRSATYSMREGLSAVASRLDPRQFLRVHRSAVIRVDRVKEIHRWTRGDYCLVLQDGTKLVTGLTYRGGVEESLLGDRKPPLR